MKIGFIGFGKMGRALAQGAVAAKTIRASQIVAFAPSDETQRWIKKKNFLWASDAQDVVDRCEFVFLCVKPQQMQSVLHAIRAKKNCFVSIAAGIPLRTFRKALGSGVPVIRVMPNTPATQLAGMSVMSVAKGVTRYQLSVIKKILSSVGEVAILSERNMDVVTALSGSGPAYVFYLAESMIESAQKLGLPKSAAEQLARQTIYGAGLMLKRSAQSASEMREAVTSKKGTTEAALEKFEAKRLKEIVGLGLRAAALRSAELSRLF